MEIVCPYCGVAHATAQSFCNGCGSALPASEQAAEKKPALSRRKLLGAVAGLVVIASAVFVMASRLSGPRQVEIVNLPAAESPLAAMQSATTPSTAEQRKYLVTAKLGAAYAAIQPLKMMLDEYRMMAGSYPVDFKAMRIDPAELTDGQYIAGVALEPGGVLLARLESTVFGDEAILKLSPTDVMAGTRTRWDCTTSIPEEERIGAPRGLPCTFDPDLRG